MIWTTKSFFDPAENSRNMGSPDEKCSFWEGEENSTFKMAKKTIFFNYKILVLRLRKGVQFAWAKYLASPNTNLHGSDADEEG